MYFLTSIAFCQSSFSKQYYEVTNNINPYALANSLLGAALAPYARQLEMTPQPPDAALIVSVIADTLSISKKEAALLITGNSHIKNSFVEHPELVKQVENELKKYKTFENIGTKYAKYDLSI